MRAHVSIYSRRFVLRSSCRCISFLLFLQLILYMFAYFFCSKERSILVRSFLFSSHAFASYTGCAVCNTSNVGEFDFARLIHKSNM